MSKADQAMKDALEKVDEVSDPRELSQGEYVEFLESFIEELETRLETAKGELGRAKESAGDPDPSDEEDEDEEDEEDEDDEDEEE